MRQATKALLFIVFLILLCSSAVAVPSWNVDKVGEIVTDNYRGVACKDSVLYVTSSYGIILMDIGDPAEPTVLNRIEIVGISNDVMISDTVLYLCSEEEGLQVFSIADLTNPRLLSKCEEAVGAYRISLSDTLAIVTTRDSFYIIDVSNLYEPELLDSYEHEAFHAAVLGNYLYISGNTTAIFDISDPTDVEIIKDIEEYSRIEIWIQDSILFTDDIWYSLEDPENPEIIYTRTDLGTDSGIFEIHGDYIWMLAEDEEYQGEWIICYEIGDPTNPTRIGGCLTSDRIGGLASNLDYHNGYIYVSGAGTAFHVIDATDPEQMQETAYFVSNQAQFSELATYGDWLYAVDRSGRRFTINISDPGSPQVTDIFEWRMRDDRIDTWFLEVANGHLFELSDFDYYDVNNRSQRHNGLFVYSLEDPSTPDSVGYLSEDSYIPADDMLIGGNVLYTAAVQDSLMSISIEDPTDPIIIDRADYYYRDYSEMDIQGDLLATGGYSDDQQMRGIVLWDVSNPASIQRIVEIDVDEQLSDATIYHGYLYARYATSLYIFEIEDTEDPEFIGTFELPSIPRELKISQDCLFAAMPYKGIYVYDISNPENLELVGSYDTPDQTWDITFLGDYLVVADNTDIGIYDVNQATGGWQVKNEVEEHDFGYEFVDSTKTVYLTLTNESRKAVDILNIIIEPDTVSNGMFEVEFDSIVTVEDYGEWGYYVTFTPRDTIEYAADLTIIGQYRQESVKLTGKGMLFNEIEDDKDLIPSEFAITSIYPNPFNSTVTISYELPHLANTTVTVYDLGGREVARLVEGEAAAGEQRIAWDATDFAAGEYFVKVVVGDASVVSKLALVK